MVIFDVPGAYLNSEIPEDKFILLNIEGGSVDIMCEVNPEHKKNVYVENVLNVLYLRLMKYLYGCMESIILRYALHSNTSKSRGFMANPYNRCISNSTIKYK